LFFTYFFKGRPLQSWFSSILLFLTYQHFINLGLLVFPIIHDPYHNPQVMRGILGVCDVMKQCVPHEAEYRIRIRSRNRSVLVRFPPPDRLPVLQLGLRGFKFLQKFIERHIIRVITSKKSQLNKIACTKTKVLKI